MNKLKNIFSSILVFYFFQALGISQTNDIYPEQIMMDEVFKMRIEENKDFTGFRINYNDKAYFVTARHCLPKSFVSGDSLTFSTYDKLGWLELRSKAYYHPNENIDIAVIEYLGENKGVKFPIDKFNFHLGQDGYMIGFPLYFKHFMPGFVRPIPFVRRIMISALSNEEYNNPSILYLEGFNTPGLSGSPVFFKTRQMDKEENEWVIAGVIKGYINQPSTIPTTKGNFITTHNSGIIVAHSSFYIAEIIENIP